jgi:ubiquinone/menaquinone biosynthesis C-methylase UbiE
LRTCSGENVRILSWVDRDANRTIFLRMLSPATEDRILDVGSGKGKIASLVQETGKCEVYALEPDEKKIEFIKSNRPSIKTIKSTADSIPFDDGFFDKIYSTMAVHHFRNQSESLKEISRVLKPTGVLVIVDISANTFLGKIARFFENGILRSGFSFLEVSKLSEILGQEDTFQVMDKIQRSSIYFVRAVRTPT